MNVKMLMTAGLLAAAMPVFAHDAGDLLVRFGPAPVKPNVDSGEVKINGTAVAGSEVDVKDGTQLGLTFAYMVTDNIAVELLASTPFEHDIVASGLPVRDVATVRHLPPTLSVVYFFDTPVERLHPYVGVGVNYTIFFNEKVSGEIVNAFGQSDMELDDSIGLAAEAGVDYDITDRWSLNASVWYMNLDTTAKIDTAAVAKIEVDVDIDPVAYVVGLSYKL